MLRLVCFALLVAVASAGKINFANCGSAGTLLSVDVEGCNAAPCDLKKGTAIRITTEFTPNSDTTSLIVNIVGKVSIITVPIVEKDACPEVAGGCPVKGGELQTHSTIINISQELVETSAKVEVKYRNAAGVIAACFSADVRIVA